jgi:peptidoglycan hydrolase-like protein with peptidoglycan-binding domain
MHIQPSQPSPGGRCLVEQLKVQLRRDGFYSGPMDGRITPELERAMAAAERAKLGARKRMSAKIVAAGQGKAETQAAEKAAAKQAKAEAKARAKASSKEEREPLIRRFEIPCPWSKLPFFRFDPGSERIRELQTSLRNMGYDPGPIDNVFGPKTRRATHQYKREHVESIKAHWYEKAEGPFCYENEPSFESSLRERLKSKLGFKR